MMYAGIHNIETKQEVHPNLIAHSGYTIPWYVIVVLKTIEVTKITLKESNVKFLKTICISFVNSFCENFY